jgi:hypothetical protein
MRKHRIASDLVVAVRGGRNATRGFEDTQSAYLADPRKLIGQVRRFGDKEVLEDPMAERSPDGTKENKDS